MEKSGQSCVAKAENERPNDKGRKTYSAAGGAGLGAAGDGRAALGAGGVGVDEGLHVGGLLW
jgi:hypothetical protein